jgi:hypothetical protein
MASAALLIFALKYSPAVANGDILSDSSGKIMMDQNSFVYNNQYYYNILVWDTEQAAQNYIIPTPKNGF